MLTAELVAEMSFPEELQLAPDGCAAVYRLRPSGKKTDRPVSALWMSSQEPTRRTLQLTTGLAEDRLPRWSPDGKQIAFLSDRACRGIALLYLIEADGGEAFPLMSTNQKGSIDEFAWSPTGEHIAFTCPDEPTEDEETRTKAQNDARVYGERWKYARLRLVTSANHEVKTLVSGDRHITNIAWSPDGNEIAYVVRRTPALESLDQEHLVERVSVAGGEPQIVCSTPRALDSLIWTNDGQALLFITSVSPHSQSSRAVFRISVEVEGNGGANMPQRIAFGEESCAMDLCQPTGSERAVVREARALETRLLWIDPHTGTCEPLLTGQAEHTGGDILAWSVSAHSSGGTAVAVVSSSGQQPSEISLSHCDHPGPLPPLAQVTSHSTALAPITFGAQEPFYWEAADGLPLDGVLIRPTHSENNAGNAPLPMVVLVHGGPYGRTTLELHLAWSHWGQWLALAGYAVLLPNYRGGMGHGESFAAAARGAVGKEDFTDVMSAVDAAVARGIADPDRLAIGGWSQGGFMSAWAVTQTQRFKAAVMGAGVSDWSMMVSSSDLPEFERELAGCAPWDVGGTHSHTGGSPIAFAHAVTTPTLILHGEQDERVPVSQAVAFHRALRETGVPVELVTYPREAHHISEYGHQIDLLQRVRSWYDRWLPK